jgi:DNA-binding transcriptional ArsR family regulator
MSVESIVSLTSVLTDVKIDVGRNAFDVSGPTISHHLRVLREKGLVDSERRGTWVHWIRPDVVRQLGGLLAATPTEAPVEDPVGA